MKIELIYKINVSLILHLLYRLRFILLIITRNFNFLVNSYNFFSKVMFL